MSLIGVRRTLIKPKPLILPPSGPSYARITGLPAFTNGSGAVLTKSGITIPAGAFVVVALSHQSTALVSSVVCGATSLTADDNATGRAAIFSGVVSAGATSIVATWASGTFQLRGFDAWIITGASSSFVQQHTSGASNSLTINVTAGDLMFAVTSGVGSGPATWPGATQVPVSPTVIYSSSPFGSSADWTIASSNASFLAASGVANPTAVATYA